MKRYKAVRNYGGYNFTVVDTETGVIVEGEYENWNQALKAARNFNKWN